MVCRLAAPDGSRMAFPTETTRMKSSIHASSKPTASRSLLRLIAIAAIGVAAAPASAGGLFGCQSCGPCGGAAHETTPYGDMGCGPRYCGPVHDDCSGVDPCDSCNRWRGCNGARQTPEMLAPWQLPPGRGFQNAAQIGYAGNGGGGICTDCCKPVYRLW